MACGIGMAVMNALSEWCVLTTTDAGSRWRQTYRAGKPQGPFERLGECGAATGTSISFKPDSTILNDVNFDAAALVDWVRGLELPLGTATMQFIDERNGSAMTESIYPAERPR
jgi:DNA gyrase/topoisomerase IV subunit B